MEITRRRARHSRDMARREAMGFLAAHGLPRPRYRRQRRTRQINEPHEVGDCRQEVQSYSQLLLDPTVVWLELPNHHSSTY